RRESSRCVVECQCVLEKREAQLRDASIFRPRSASKGSSSNTSRCPMPLSNSQTRDVQALLHPYTNLMKHRETGPLIFDHGKGCRVYDEQGKDYIEAMAGLWCTALGWGEEALADVAAEQMRKMAL